MTADGCGALGCRRDADVRIDHPKHGTRTVCQHHARDYPIEGPVPGGEAE